MTQLVVDLAHGIKDRQRGALARAITLVESTHPAHREQAIELLDMLLPERNDTTRVAFTGPPGAGKSTLINALTSHVTGAGHCVAVLAIDPTSARSGGALLGDRTRMVDQSQNENVFIRSSPSGLTLGGVAQRTRDVMLLCEAAGFDTVFIETVGVGQSEFEAAQMVDCFVLLLAPGGGDELQAIKAGIVEYADIVAVNKADGDLALTAKRLRADYESALGMGHGRVPSWTRPVLLTSAETGLGIDDLWNAISAFETNLDADGTRARWRAEQRLGALHDALVELLVERAEKAAGTAPDLETLRAEVAAGRISPLSAATHLANDVRF
ncbi:MAG: methylmalonyl Co-A mutase-associated GTPase MeaB [Acidimicrobiia bacterium]